MAVLHPADELAQSILNRFNDEYRIYFEQGCEGHLATSEVTRMVNGGSVEILRLQKTRPRDDASLSITEALGEAAVATQLHR